MYLEPDDVNSQPESIPRKRARLYDVDSDEQGASANGSGSGKLSMLGVYISEENEKN